jgi:hypothetical protein
LALTNLAVTCGYMGEGEHGLNNQNVFGQAVWAENLAAGTTTQAAPSPGVSGAGTGRPVFQVVAAAASWVVTGATALNAALAVSTKPSEARIYIPANTPVNIYVNPGDKLAWIAA